MLFQSKKTQRLTFHTLRGGDGAGGGNDQFHRDRWIIRYVWQTRLSIHFDRFGVDLYSL